MEILEFNDEKFPKSLRKIKNPPKRIWVEGNKENLNLNSIAIVGSRNNTDYGKKWCKIFTKELIEYNLVIVSGMAVGIDSIAHTTALKYGGKTIAVLPSGLNNIFPEENIKLYRKILDNGGTVITEYPPNEKKTSYKCLERNRIVSGLSLGTLVIEAAYRSGTSVTADITKSEKKKVFCIPGNLENEKSVGTNTLIKKYAKLVTDVEDIVENYRFLSRKNELKENLDYTLNDIKEEYREVYKAIIDKPKDINMIAKETNLPINEVMAKITMLEIEDKIKRTEGNKFIRRLDE